MDLHDLTLSKVKDDSGKLENPGDYQNAITEALKRYSGVRPRRVPADIQGNGGHDYDLPGDWVPEFSTFESIEYPVGQIPELFIDRRDYKLYLAPAGTKLRIISASPDPDEILRAVYTVTHTEETLPVNDIEAVANLAAANCLRMLAAGYGQTSDPTINADVVNYRSKADEFRRLADSFEQQYNDHLGIGKDAPVAAACAVTTDQDNGPVGLVHLNSRVRITHGRRA
jgi:hypothetical protein